MPGAFTWIAFPLMPLLQTTVPDEDETDKVTGSLQITGFAADVTTGAGKPGVSVTGIALETGLKQIPFPLTLSV
jgi:hypothetical protein